jgi:hypothetical protein
MSKVNEQKEKPKSDKEVKKQSIDEEMFVRMACNSSDESTCLHADRFQELFAAPVFQKRGLN